MKRVLYISYSFPPVGGAGVQRVAKFVKFTQQHGWIPSVLTVANPSVPVKDDSLSRDVPRETVVGRARTWEPGYALKRAVSAGEGAGENANGRTGSRVKRALRALATLLLQPDPQILWAPAAIWEGMRLLREFPHEAIVASAPPFSSFVIGAILSRRTGIPLVLDYRDEWGLANQYFENRRADPLSRRIQMAMQQGCIKQASALIATTESSALALKTVRDAAASRAEVTCIYNGFDPDDFVATGPCRERRTDVYRLAYTGTLWNLTSVAPLVAATEQLANRRPDLCSRLELVFAGRRTAAQDRILMELRKLPCRLICHSYMEHADVLALVRSADGLCLLLSDVPGAERVVPAKIFEYMAAMNTVFAIAPAGEARELLASYPAKYLCAPGDPAAIAAAMEHAIERHFSGVEPPAMNWDPSKYSRKGQTAKLLRIIDRISMDRHPRGARFELPISSVRGLT